jgi:exopolysaccharide biosynthesis polyprenyl glycosylphosphotransferase
VSRGTFTRAPSHGLARLRRAGELVPLRAAWLLFESRSRQPVRDRDRLYRRALAVGDLAAGLLTVALAATIFGPESPGASSLVLVGVIPFVYTAAGLYRRDELVIAKTTLDEAPNVFQAATLTTVVGFLSESAMLQMPIGAKLMAVTWVALTVSTLSCRVLARSVARRLSPPERCLVIGGDDDAARLIRKFEVGGVIKAKLVGRWAPAGDGLAVGSLNDLPAVVNRSDIHRVIIAGDPESQAEVTDAIRVAKSLGVHVSLLPRMLDAVGSSVAFDYVNGLTLLGVQRFGLSTASRRMKRTFDVVGASVAVVLLAPLMAAIALAVKLSSPGPLLFRQIRVGRDGRAFVMLKFRTMHKDADDRKGDLRELNEADGLFKIDDDPRMTRVGRLLRRSSLDELPQLFNVLRGQMSLVGPRPLVVDEDRRILGWRRDRLRLTPGMTGHWQVLGSARIPLAEMVTIDYLYIANWSLWGDLKILLRTIPHVMLRRGQ